MDTLSEMNVLTDIANAMLEVDAVLQSHGIEARSTLIMTTVGKMQIASAAERAGQFNKPVNFGQDVRGNVKMHFLGRPTILTEELKT